MFTNNTILIKNLNIFHYNIRLYNKLLNWIFLCNVFTYVISIRHLQWYNFICIISVNIPLVVRWRYMFISFSSLPSDSWILTLLILIMRMIIIMMMMMMMMMMLIIISVIWSNLDWITHYRAVNCENTLL